MKKEVKEKEQKMATIDAMQRLVEIMNNTSRTLKLGNKEWKISALKPATQWLIAEESIKIQKNETANYSDVIKQFAINTPSVVRVITLALLNDKDRIFKDYKAREYSDEYYTTYDMIMWETDEKEWIKVLFEVLQMLDLDFFFNITNVVATLRNRALVRKTSKEEQKLSSVEPNGGK